MAAPGSGGVRVVGVDVGGTSTRVGLVDEDGNIVRRQGFPTRKGSLAALGEVVRGAVADMLGEVDGPAPIAAGIGLRGIVDLDAQRYVGSTLFSDTEHYDLRNELASAFGIPVRLANDVNAAAAAELRWGIGRERPCFTYINIGTGIGAAVVDHGHLLRGTRDTAGEIAHYVLVGVDGHRGSHNLESVVSGAGLDQGLRRLSRAFSDSLLDPALDSGSRVTASQLFGAYGKADPLARAVVDGAVTAVAQVVVNIEAIAGSGCYVFGGGVLSDAEWFVNRIGMRAQGLAAEAGVPWNASTRVSSLGVDGAGLLGAAALALTAPD